jgi:glycosyltransferase involved in cell wall biosynthesis
LNIHIYPSVFANESRILKIVRSLKERAVFSQIQVVAVWKAGLAKREVIEAGIEVLRVAPVFGSSVHGRAGQLIKAVGWYIGVLLALRGQNVVCLSCHSLPVLPLSVLLKFFKQCVLIYEPHELETETAGLKGIRQVVARRLERWLIRSADAICVVNQSIADWYRQNYRRDSIWVVRNVPYRSATPPEPTGLLRSSLGIKPKSQIYLYQGLLAPGRGINLLMNVFKTLPAEKNLVFLGYGELEPEVKTAATRHSNIHFLPAVPPHLLKDYTSDADVGLSLIENVCLSYYLCLPNKVFEYAACGVPVVASAFPEMARFVHNSGSGWTVFPEISAVRDFMLALSADDISEKREQIKRLGVQEFWQIEEQRLMAMYASVGFSERNFVQ